MSSYVVIAPEALAAASVDLTGIGSLLGSATAASAGSTTLVVISAQDKMSAAAVAALFGGYGRDFQAASARAASFHSEFVRALDGASGRMARLRRLMVPSLRRRVSSCRRRREPVPAVQSPGGANGSKGYKGKDVKNI
jgi:hypothetical protein